MRWTAAFASLLLACAATAQGKDEKEPKKPEQAVLLVPQGPAVALNGKVTEKGPEGAARIALSRGKVSLGTAWIHRHQRQLYIVSKSTIPAAGVGVRLNFTDPASLRKIVVLVMPMNPPRAPITIFRMIPGRKPAPIPAKTCDVRFDVSRPDGFDMQLRIPLDLIEIARAKKRYNFSAELWDLANNRVIAAYPLTGEGPVAGRGLARMSPKDHWGSDVALSTKAPPDNEAIALLEEIQGDKDTGAGVLQAHTGHEDGQRKDGPLKKLQDDLQRLMKQYPDYLSLHANLVRVLRARNRFPETLAALDGIPKHFPFMRGNRANVMARIEILYVMGKYEEAIKALDEAKKLIPPDQATPMRRMFVRLARNWKLEQSIRAKEAERNDLPRVRFTTNRGTVVVELFEDDAPNAVANVIQLVESGFYDGTRFHWVSGGGRVVGGDPNSRDEDPYNDGYGDPGYMIESEPGRRLQFPFTVALADKRHKKRTEGCTLMVNITPLPGLDGVNTVIGHIVEGKETILALEYYDRIEKAEVLRKRSHEYKVVKRP